MWIEVLMSVVVNIDISRGSIISGCCSVVTTWSWRHWRGHVSVPMVDSFANEGCRIKIGENFIYPFI